MREHILHRGHRQRPHFNRGGSHGMFFRGALSKERGGLLGNGCGMAGMADDRRVKRQSCNSAKLSSIMYISLSAGRFSAACNLSSYPSLLRSVDGWGARETESLHRAAQFIQLYIQNSTVIISATPIFD